MTQDQIIAFEAGSGVTPSELLIAIASIVIVLTFIWVIWISLGSFRAWRDGQVGMFDLMWNAIRASIVLMVLGFYLR